MIVVEGKYFAKAGAQYDTVKVKLYDSGQLYFDTPEGVTVNALRSELEVSDKLGSIPREVSLPDKALLIFESDVLIDNWLQSKQDRVGQWESSPKAVILSLLLVPLTIYFIFALVLPKAAEVFAPLVPQSVINVTSKQTMRALDEFALQASQADPQMTAFFKQHWLTLIDEMDLSFKGYNIQFRYSEAMGPNAFALPDGTIVFTDQLIELVEYDQDILTAIFIHELGHVEEHHSMRLISQTIVTALAVDFILGDVSGLLEVFAGVTNTVTANRFSQALEWEADNFALQHMQKAGMDPVDFAKGMQKFSELRPEGSGLNEDLERILSSHPITQERIDNALEYADISLEEFYTLIGKNTESESTDADSETLLEQ